jgi:hypothetical protein
MLLSRTHCSEKPARKAVAIDTELEKVSTVLLISVSVFVCYLFAYYFLQQLSI